MESSLSRRCLAEFVGTFILVWLGTGAVVVEASHPGTLGHAGVALSFGFVVLAMIYAIGDISGAHINPAVSIAFAVAGRLGWRDAVSYSISQSAGAIVGSFAVLHTFGDAKRLGATFYTCSTPTAIGTEFLLTAVLMFVIMGVSTGAKEKSITAGIAVGVTVALDAMVGGPITGASMNPARSLGPAIVGLDLAQIWLYLVIPCFGAIAGVGVHLVISPPTESTQPSAN